MLAEGKEIILRAGGEAELEGIADEAKRAGIRRVIVPGLGPGVATAGGLRVVGVSEVDRGADSAAWVKISDAVDLDRAVKASSEDHAFVVVECSNWRVIPLENLIADFRRNGKKLYAFVQGVDETTLAFSIMEKGVDGVVIPVDSLGEVTAKLASAGALHPYSLGLAKVEKIVDVGVGDRVCVDTISQLSLGEGLLVGSKADFFFLVHGETIPTAYIPTRSFRVNAGSLHSYVLSSGEKTKYLSELEAASRVLVVDSGGGAREVAVGRVKIERRPLLMVQAAAGAERGGVVLQNAETIRLVRGDGSTISVTDLKVGDEVLVHHSRTKGRHFGGGVDEFVVEK